MFQMPKARSCIRCGCPISYTAESFVISYCLGCRVVMNRIMKGLTLRGSIPPPSPYRLKFISQAEVNKIPRVQLYIGNQKQVLFTMACSSGKVSFQVYQAEGYLRLVRAAKGTRWN